MEFKVSGVNHIGLAPKDPKQAKYFFESVLALTYDGQETVTDQMVNTDMFSSSQEDLSLPTRLEILEATDENSPIQKFLDKRGSGIHHIALTVSDVEKAVAHLKEKNITLIDETPRKGAHNTKIVFVHPKSTGGLLVELVQQL